MLNTGTGGQRAFKQTKRAVPRLIIETSDVSKSDSTSTATSHGDGPRKQGLIRARRPQVVKDDGLDAANEATRDAGQLLLVKHAVAVWGYARVTVALVPSICK